MTPSATILSKFEWNQAKWIDAFCRVPALLICLCLAITFHEQAGGVVAAGAALSVGLVGSRQIAGSPFLAMMATTFIMALSTWVGTLVGNNVAINLVVTALWSLGFAFLTIHDEDSGWISMQGVICLVIASAFPNHGYAALERGLAVLVGGMIQIAVLSMIGLLHRRFCSKTGAAQAEAPPPAKPTYKWKEFFNSFKTFSPAWRYALRVSLTLIVAVEIAGLLHIQNAYWLPMTTLIILKPDFYKTYAGAIQRVAGTFLGVVVASLIAHLFHPSLEWLILLVAVFSFGCFALLKVNPIPFSAALTAYVVFLISTTGLPETSITGHRLMLTALGCALALGSRVLGRQTMLLLFRDRLKN